MVEKEKQTKPGEESSILVERSQQAYTVEFGPIGETNYKEFARKLINEGMVDGTLNADDRAKMWERLATVEQTVTDKIRALGGGPIEIIPILEDAIWEQRIQMGSAYAEDKKVVAWSTYRSRRIRPYVAPRSEFKKIVDTPAFGLDAHHVDVEFHGRPLINGLIAKAKEEGIVLPVSEQKLRLTPTLMRIHDIFKWIAKFNSKDSIAADHEEIIRYFVNKYFLGQTIDGVLVTPELANWMAEALGNHENFGEEESWAKESKERDDHGETISLMFYIDTMSNDENLSRYRNLARRHLRLFIGDEQPRDGENDFKVAKAYRPQWILSSSLDLARIMQSWEEKYGVKVPQEKIEHVFDVCQAVFAEALIILERMQDRPDKTLKTIEIENCLRLLSQDRARLFGGDGGNRELDAEHETFLQVAEAILMDKDQMNAIAVATGAAYAERSQHKVADCVMDSEQQQIVKNGRSYWRRFIDERDISVEAIGNNSVGFIQLYRLLSLMEVSSDPKVQEHAGDSLQEKLDLLSGTTTTIPNELLEIGTRGSHAGWMLGVHLGGKDVEAPILPFDKREQLLNSSDWLQIRNASRYVRSKMHAMNIETLEDFSTLYADRSFMIECAKYCHEGYVATQREHYMTLGKNAPAWLDVPFLSEADEADFKDTPRGLNTDTIFNWARVTYADNIAASLALLEDVATISNLRHISPREVLRSILNGRITSSDRAILTTSQKALYLQMQVYKGRYSNTVNPIRVESLRVSTPNRDTIEDWAQLQESATILLNQLSTHILSDDEVDLSLEHTDNRPTRVVDQDADTQELGALMHEMGIRKPDSIYMFSGGAVFMEGGIDLQAFQNLLVASVVNTLNNGENVLIVTGGTNSGFMRIAGEIAEQVKTLVPQRATQLQVLGVSPKALLTFDESQVNNDRFKAATGHTHHLLVQSKSKSSTGAEVTIGDSFGDETNTIKNVLSYFGTDKVVKNFIVGNGGPGTIAEIRAAYDIKYPVLAVKGSYRAADLLGAVLKAHTYKGYQELLESRTRVNPTDPDEVKAQKARTLREKDNIFLFLRASDPDVDLVVSDKLQRVPQVSEANYLRVRSLLLKNPDRVRSLSIEELGEALSDQEEKRNILGGAGERPRT